METVVGETGAVSADRCLSPEQDTASPYCLSLLRAACRNVAAPDLRPRPPPGDVTMAASDVITNGPRRSRPLGSRLTSAAAADADAFFEYDLECGMGVAPMVGVTVTTSHASAAEEGGTDTGCALTSPIDVSREASCTTSPLADHCMSGPTVEATGAATAVGSTAVTAAAAPLATVSAAATTDADTGVVLFSDSGEWAAQADPGAHSPAGNASTGPAAAFYHTNQHRHLYENPLQVASSAPVAVPGGRRANQRDSLRRSVAEAAQPSPSEKVDAWLRACDVTASDDVTNEDLTVCFSAGTGDDSTQDIRQEDKQESPEVPDEEHEGTLEESLTDADELDIRELLTRGCEMLDLTPMVSAEDREMTEHLPESQPQLQSEALPDIIVINGPHDAPVLLERGEEEEQTTKDTEPAEEDEVTADDDEQTASVSCESSDFTQSPNRYKRCSSLKTSKTPPLTPGRKKFVRFADALGLDLQQVRHFKDELPHVPHSAFAGLEDDELLVCGSPDMPTPLMRHPATRPSALSGLPRGRQLVPLFLQPCVGRGFQERLRAEKVALVSVTCREDDWSVRCLVRVLNMDYYKSVCARHTLDEWRTWTDVSATYVNGSCDGLSDKFQFTLKCDNLAPGQRLHFAVAFRCQGQEFWDNNSGNNYTVLCAATEERTLAGGRQSECSHGRF